MYFLDPTLQCFQFVSSEMTRAINIQSRHKNNKREKKEIRKTYNGRVNAVLDLGESLVHIDPQGLGEVSAVVVLAVLRVQPLDVVIGDVTPAPQEGGELDVVLGGRGPDWLHIVLIIGESERISGLPGLSPVKPSATISCVWCSARRRC